MATYNGQRWVDEQIATIRSQRDVDVHLLISDDGSKDATPHILADAANSYSDVTLMPPSCPTGSAGGNFRHLLTAADIGDFDYVALADQDDIWHSGKLARAVDQLSKSGKQLYSSATRAAWPNGTIKTMKQNASIRAADFLFEGAGQGCTFVMSRSFFIALQAFCRTEAAVTAGLHYHDWMIYVFSRARQCTWLFDQTPFMDYRQHLDNELGARGGRSGIVRRIDQICNGWYARQVFAAARVFFAAGGASTEVTSILHLMEAPPGLCSKALLAIRLLKFGRRRLGDRLVLACAAALGWMQKPPRM